MSVRDFQQFVKVAQFDSIDFCKLRSNLLLIALNTKTSLLPFVSIAESINLTSQLAQIKLNLKVKIP
jgi:hypothetical protein